jgi:glycosyltransferase involved in cell wall biosynthesis
MRILHLNVLYPPLTRGGAERFVATLAQEQAKLGHDVGVVTLTPKPESPKEESGVLVHRIGHANLFWFEDWPKHAAPIRYANKLLANWNPVIQSRVRKVVESFQPDVVNSHCMIAFAVDSWKAAAERNIPIVHALHEFNLFCRNTNAFRNGRMCEGVCLSCRITSPKRWLSRLTSGVVGVSRDVLQRHLDRGFFNHIPPERRSIIWSMPPIPIRDRPARSPDAPLTIGFIGRMVPEKGIELLIEAVAGLPTQGWQLLIAGKVYPPLDAATLRARTAGLPVEWLGVVPAADFYPQIDLLVVPAVWADPGPLVVHEAFANAVPVVGSRMGGIADLVEDGATGWHFEPGNAVALREVLAKRIREGRAKLPNEAAFAQFRAETTPERVAERYVDVYRTVIDGSTSQRSLAVKQR